MIPSQADQIREAALLHERRIKELHESTDKVDNIQSVLMDYGIGPASLCESDARIKAVAIYTLVREWK